MEQLTFFSEVLEYQDFRYHPSLYVEARVFHQIPDSQPVNLRQLLGEGCDANHVDALLFAVRHGRDWQIPVLLNRLPVETHGALLAVAHEYAELSNQVDAASDEEYRHLQSRTSELRQNAPEILRDYWHGWYLRHKEFNQAFRAHYGMECDHFWLPDQPRAIYGMVVPAGWYSREFEQGYEDALYEVNPSNPWRVAFVENPDWRARWFSVGRK